MGMLHLCLLPSNLVVKNNGTLLLPAAEIDIRYKIISKIVNEGDPLVFTKGVNFCIRKLAQKCLIDE